MAGDGPGELVLPADLQGAGAAGAGLKNRLIIFVLATLDMGGAERQALVIASGLAEQYGARVEVWGLHGGQAVAARCAELGLPCRAFSPPYGGGRIVTPGLLWRLAAALRRARPDAVLAYTFYANVACGLVVPWSRAGYLVWGQRDSGALSTWRGVEVLAARGAACFIANSAQGVDYLAHRLHAPRQRIHLIPNGVALPAARLDRAGWRRQLAVDDDQPLVGMLGNLTLLKDHATVLKAWRLVVDRLGEAQRPVLVLAGRWADGHAEVVRLVGALHLQDSVRLAGFVEDVAGLLAACDLAVLGSRDEGSPNAVLEPMLAGLAVVATDLPGTRAILGEHSACLAAVGDAPALAERILHLLSEAELRHTIGRNNRALIEQAYTPRASVERHARLLLEALGHGAGAYSPPQR